MTRRLGWLLAVLVSTASPGLAQVTAASLRVREVADSNLRDVAVAVADPVNPVIYYNPRLMRRFGPGLSAFVLAHEYGHIRFGHRRPTGRLQPGLDRDSLLRVYELEADCYAGQVLARVQPEAATVAIEFFRKMADFRYDQEHPTGVERADRIESCLDLETELEGVAAGISGQVVASLRRIPGEPAPLAVLKSSAVLDARKSARREAKPDRGIRKETGLADQHLPALHP